MHYIGLDLNEYIYFKISKFTKSAEICKVILRYLYLTFLITYI
jgi:hypothetical protein